MTAVLPLVYLDDFRRRVVEDALAEAAAIYWHRRAAAFERARPRPDDWSGQATAVELAARDRRLAEIVLACHHRAVLARASSADPDGARR